MSTGADSVAASRLGAEELDAALERVVLDTGASVGLVYLLVPGERVLHLAVVSGAPVRLAAPWARVPLDSPELMAEAVRERRLVWLGSQEEVALRYPRTGLLLPYDFMVAAAPMVHGTIVWGALVLLWPARDPPKLDLQERDAMNVFSCRAGLFLQQAADRGSPLLPAPSPGRCPGGRPVSPGGPRRWLLRRPDGRTEPLELPPGLLLGIDPAATYPTTEIPLPPGAALALYTDGLVETPGTDIDDTIADLANHLAHAEDQTMDALADNLIQHATHNAAATWPDGPTCLRRRGSSPVFTSSGGWRVVPAGPRCHSAGTVSASLPVTRPSRRRRTAAAVSASG
ncbi:SpoIIE family protein phosphatase [Streptomyces sp. PA03-6a]|nr:SpoIIE family protein phosphatase [Streptomyces sp. PA03-6a]